eukprot:CAMPEP_0180204414 /NCGR_PEP_ID=MMETSP0987-20121128/8404_1 /TAXON_ID=697907 /ORGANISM="non described non described, Strain CCMP2293" /LENGTH=129 /DNA_ID=CAMNT_0022159913 /DNA_START=230 /DNA_END=620 /DNA_ORIENTATION=-
MGSHSSSSAGSSTRPVRRAPMLRGSIGSIALGVTRGGAPAFSAGRREKKPPVDAASGCPGIPAPGYPEAPTHPPPPKLGAWVLVLGRQLCREGHEPAAALAKPWRARLGDGASARLGTQRSQARLRAAQ